MVGGITLTLSRDCIHWKNLSFLRQMAGNAAWRGIFLPSSIGIVIINHYKDPYEPTSIMECQPRVLLPVDDVVFWFFFPRLPGQFDVYLLGGLHQKPPSSLDWSGDSAVWLSEGRKERLVRVTWNYQQTQLKMDGWKMIPLFLGQKTYFQGRFGGVTARQLENRPKRYKRKGSLPRTIFSRDVFAN